MPTVLISRGSVSGGQTVAQCLAEQTGSRCLSREDLVRLVDEKGEYAQKVIRSLHSAARAYDQFSKLRRSYIVLMRYALLKFIMEGNVVYHGYSGHLLIPNIPCCLRIRINEPIAFRMKHTMEKMSLTKDEAMEAELKRDEDRVRWARFMYGQDIRNPDLYDACFCLERLSAPAICSMIGAAFCLSELQDSPDSRKKMNNIFLGASVEAALATAPITLGKEVGAKAKDGAILLEGPYMEKHDLDALKTFVSAIPGVIDVEYQPGYPSDLGFGPPEG